MGFIAQLARQNLTGFCDFLQVNAFIDEFLKQIIQSIRLNRLFLKPKGKLPYDRWEESIKPFVFYGLMRPARLERATFWFVAKRSIQLSYGRI